MALVVFLRGVNVGGHRTFRPSVLAQELRAFDVVSVGAAGTFVVRRPVSRTRLRAELASRLPFDAHVVICTGADLLRFADSHPFREHRSHPSIIPFVSVLAKARKPSSPLPLRFPATGAWTLRIQGQQGRFVYGIYRRTMRAISHLGQLDQLFGSPATTRSWNTIAAIARLLEAPKG
jgi:uncharacterized protein (DUF1697 family)